METERISLSQRERDRLKLASAPSTGQTVESASCQHVLPALPRTEVSPLKCVAWGIGFTSGMGELAQGRGGI